MPTDHKPGPNGSEPTTGWLFWAEETLGRVAAERGLDFAPIPVAVAAALPGLVGSVERLVAGMDGRERQWLAALLAGLSAQA
jgi:hypothetical protein